MRSVHRGRGSLPVTCDWCAPGGGRATCGLRDRCEGGRRPPVGPGRQPDPYLELSRGTEGRRYQSIRTLPGKFLCLSYVFFRQDASAPRNAIRVAQPKVPCALRAPAGFGVLMKVVVPQPKLPWRRTTGAPGCMGRAAAPLW